MGSKSAQKVARGSAKRNVRSQATRSQVKTEISAAEKLINAGDAKAKEAAAKAARALDKAAGKKVLHPNNAARRKSRLMKKLAKMGGGKPKATPEKAA